MAITAAGMDADTVTVHVDENNTFRVVTTDWDQEAPSKHELLLKLREARGGNSRGRKSGSGSGGLLGIVAVALVLWVAFDSVHIVDEAEQGVVLRFGAYDRTQPPGINFTLPRPFETMMKVNVRNVRSLEDRGSMLTQDENLVEFLYKVQYQVSSARDFLFEVRDPETTVIEAAESALRESVGTSRLDAILEGTQREAIRIETQRVLQETLDRYQAGVQINQFNLEDVNVPAAVREAYSDVIRAREDKERFIEEARVHANSVVPEARPGGELQAAAVNPEKLTKGVEEKAPPVKELNLRFSELGNALNQALTSAQSLGLSAEENVCKLSDEEMAGIPAEFAKDIAKRIRDAAEMGDVMTLNAIAEEIKAHSNTCIPLSKQIIQMAEDFDLDGIQKLAEALNAG